MNKNIKLSNNKASVCVPLVGRNKEEIKQECELVIKEKPDLVEWRADSLSNFSEEYLMECLEVITNMLIDYPIVFTLRIDKEGGNISLDQKERANIIKNVIATGKIDLVDIELINEEWFITEVFELAKKHNVLTILSNHNFKSTPDNQDIISTLKKMKKWNCDIAKVAYMPQNTQDFLRLMEITENYSKAEGNPLVIAISMGKTGVLSRIGASQFGSCLTFAMLKESSAPGQLSVKDIRGMMEIID